MIYTSLEGLNENFANIFDPGFFTKHLCNKIPCVKLSLFRITILTDIEIIILRLKYGFYTNNSPLAIVNFVGCSLHTSYTVCYYIYTLRSRLQIQKQVSSFALKALLFINSVKFPALPLESYCLLSHFKVSSFAPKVL